MLVSGLKHRHRLYARCLAFLALLGTAAIINTLRTAFAAEDAPAPAPTERRLLTITEIDKELLERDVERVPVPVEQFLAKEPPILVGMAAIAVVQFGLATRFLPFMAAAFTSGITSGTSLS